MPKKLTQEEVDKCLAERGFVCPSCGSEEIEVTRRVCGYLGSPGSRPFNSGKQKEVLGRVKHLNLK